jgi:hypothetical protein
MPPYRAQLEHRLVSDAITDPWTFTFSDYGPSVLVQIRGGNADRYRGGKVATIAGAITLGVGGLVLLAGLAIGNARIPLVAAGSIGAVVGVASLVPGILAMVQNRTLIDMDADPSEPDAPVPSPVPDGPVPVPL